MKSRTIIAMSFGLLLLAGSAMATRKIVISPRTGPDEDAPREVPASDLGAKDESGQVVPVQLRGFFRTNRRQGLTLSGERILLGANCGVFPNWDPGRLPDPRDLNGRQATVFGFRTRAGIDARLLILDSNRDVSAPMDPKMQQELIPSLSDPDVGEIREGAPE